MLKSNAGAQCHCASWQSARTHHMVCSKENYSLCHISFGLCPDPQDNLDAYDELRNEEMTPLLATKMMYHALRRVSLSN